MSTGATTEYAGNFIYEDGELKFFSHPEGYTQPDQYGKFFDYVYQFKDHLGNIRLTYADSDGDGKIDASEEIISENNYYPFGLEHKGYNNVVSANSNSVASKFDYQSQELEESLGYKMHEFELRHYDAAVGRFVTTDPYEQFMSPYVAMGNNPIVSFDPDGGNCLDVNGNSIACPDGAEYDQYRDNNSNHIDILDEVVINSTGNSESSETNSSVRSLEEACERCVKKGERLELSMNNRPDGILRDLDELSLNILGHYYRDGIRVNASGISLDSRGLNEAYRMDGVGSISLVGGGAANGVQTSIRAMIKNISLPTSGKIRFIPRDADKLSRKILKKDGGFVDKFGNIWRRPKGAIQGEAHWDVTLSATGKAQLGHLSNSGQHINVTVDGRIAH